MLFLKLFKDHYASNNIGNQDSWRSGNKNPWPLSNYSDTEALIICRPTSLWAEETDLPLGSMVGSPVGPESYLASPCGYFDTTEHFESH